MSHASKIPSTEAAARALVEAGALSTAIAGRIHYLRSADGREELVFVTGADGEVNLFAPATKAIRRSFPAPQVARQNIHLTRVEDLVFFTKRFALPGTVIFAVAPSDGPTFAGFTTVIDYSNSSSDLGWNRNRAFVPCGYSAKLRVWADAHYTQAGFADLLDTWADKIVEHGDATPSALLIMAQDLEVEENRVCKAKRNAQGLWEVALKEDSKATTKIYPKFRLLLPIIEGRPEREVEIRLKLVKSGATYNFHVVVHDLDALVQAEFDMMAKELAADAGVPVLQGTPPAEMEVGI